MSDIISIIKEKVVENPITTSLSLAAAIYIAAFFAHKR